MPGKRQDVLYQAQAILSRRDHSTAEVKAKLKRKAFTEKEIAKAIGFLQEKKLLDDARFAKAYAESILRAKLVGPRYLQAKLKQKGVGEGIIRETLVEVRGREADLAEQAMQQWKKSHPSTSSGQVPKHKQKQRLFRFLASRGFTHDAISAIMDIYES